MSGQNLTKKSPLIEPEWLVRAPLIEPEWRSERAPLIEPEWVTSPVLGRLAVA